MGADIEAIERERLVAGKYAYISQGVLQNSPANLISGGLRFNSRIEKLGDWIVKLIDGNSSNASTCKSSSGNGILARSTNEIPTSSSNGFPTRTDTTFPNGPGNFWAVHWRRGDAVISVDIKRAKKAQAVFTPQKLANKLRLRMRNTLGIHDDTVAADHNVKSREGHTRQGYTVKKCEPTKIFIMSDETDIPTLLELRQVLWKQDKILTYFLMDFLNEKMSETSPLRDAIKAAETEID